MKKLILLSLLLGLVSCGKGGSSGKGDVPVSQKDELSTRTGETTEIVASTFKVSVKKKVELLNDFSNLEDFKSHINTYTVQFDTLSGHYMDSKVECQRAFFDGAKDLFIGTFDKTGAKAEVEIQLSKSDISLVEFECVLSTKGEEQESVSVKLLKNYVITGVSSFAASIGADKFGTLLLDKDAVLSTNGIDTSLNIKELISIGGKIVTHEESKTNSTRDLRPGASGGLIEITTENALGSLTVELRGLNGGKQTNVPEKETRIPPRDPKLDGVGTAGKRGLKGYKGKKGFDGFPGGDSGSLRITFLKNNNLKLNVNYFPGKGSNGSFGGIGGPGGPGGKGAIEHYNDPNDTSGSCPRCGQLNIKGLMRIIEIKHPDGPNGPQGDEGEPGLPGEDGKILESRYIDEKGFRDFPFNYDWKNYKEPKI